MPVVQNFDAAVGPYRAELRAYCYRMLGSISDADDAVQETLLSAYRGLESLEQASALRAWLYRIATNACLRVIAARPKRLLAADYAPPERGVDLADMVSEPVWLEPFPDDPGASLELRESVELAFVAALQHLPATQRAVLVLCEVLGFEAAEAASALETSVAAVTSALQRARKAAAERVPQQSQQATLRELGEARERELVARFIDAWGRSDVQALLALFTDDIRFAMPPIPSWFDGRDAVGRFLAERVFQTPWRLVQTRANGQLAFVCYQGPDFGIGAINVVTLRGGLIAEMTGFLDPRVKAHFSSTER
jgi:RNA polymerase sigma-70 factor (TIGR02960 family)